MANDSLAAQAKNNPEEQFAIGTFKFESTDVVIESQDAQNAIAAPMLKKPQIFVGDESAKQLAKYA